MSKLTLEEAALKLGVKTGDLADAGERYGLPWAKSNAGTEYVIRSVFSPTHPDVVVSERVCIVAGTHTAAPKSLAIPEFDPAEAPPSDEPYWPHLMWRSADELDVHGGRSDKVALTG